MTENDSKQVNIRVEQWRYDEWSEHVGRDPGDEYETMSQLIRRAVGREIADDGGRVPETTAVQADMSVVTDDVLPALERIESELGRLDDRLSAVERERTAENRSGADLERIILELLPSESELEGLDGAKSVTDLAKMTGTSPDDVKDVLDQLNDRRTQPIAQDRDPHPAPEGEESPFVYYRRK